MEIKVRLYLPKELEYLKDLAKIRINKQSVLTLFLSSLLEELFIGVDEEKAIGFIMDKARKKAFHNAQINKSAKNLVKSIFDLKLHLKSKTKPKTELPYQEIYQEINPFSKLQSQPVNSIKQQNIKTQNNQNEKFQNNNFSNSLDSSVNSDPLDSNSNINELPDLDEISW